ncbi:MAG TPA: formate--tetrahydrofolate ligase [Candidatus Thalassarchaeaceae archaeon]|nr:MAG TPA: formate--tetrahydrofolate ligase [Candidatus Poseidoniales archaeon]HIH82812.1 formate--tetrahydrofolate ligase [Candidatus Thalassarchaeaceae archaeon]
MPSDLEIVRDATPLPIEEVAWKLGLGVEDISLKGNGIAKVTWEALKARRDNVRGVLVLVTSVNPTPFGEGKTVTTIGLNQGLNRLGKNAVCVIREPSMGPVFGIKGGAAGGGYSQVLPMEQINLHFTGDIHAVSAAHNLCSALLDNHLHQGNKLDIDPSRVIWPRVIDMNDRSLRYSAIGLGGALNGFAREERFDITAASEVMAILALASDYKDLRQRLAQIVIGQNRSGNPVKVEDIGAAGPMSLLLRDALLPNLVQTLEGDPAFIHAGPFANIAHGNSSLIADRLALATSDYVITEAGFGSDMGAEKAIHIKTAASGIPPDCIVINATIRSMKLHGGGFSSSGGQRPTSDEIAKENVAAVTSGAMTNLARHVRNMKRFLVPVIVSVNRFSTDTEAEVQELLRCARECEADNAVIFDGHQRGGAGAADLANAVSAACQDHLANGRPFEPLFDSNMSVVEKMLRIATMVYGADSIDLHKQAERDLKLIKKWKYDKLAVCMAKTQYSFSHVAQELGAPSGFTLPIREIRLNAGAGFVVPICGSIMTMPGLPKQPAAMDMDMDEDGNFSGAFS